MATPRPDLPALRGRRGDRRATAKDAGDRFPDVTMVATEFRAALEGTSVEIAAGPTRNPYKGLRAFSRRTPSTSSAERPSTAAIRSLAEDDPAARFLAVVGPSGSGKSSVVRVGLVPAMRRGVIPGSERWYVIELLPGSHPFRDLESALLGVAVEPPPSFMEVLERDELGIARAAERVLPQPRCRAPHRRGPAGRALHDDGDPSEPGSSEPASGDARAKRQTRVVATLRADFYDVPSRVPRFGDLLAARTEAITPMSPEELERAIVAPADQAGLVWNRARLPR